MKRHIMLVLIKIIIVVIMTSCLRKVSIDECGPFSYRYDNETLEIEYNESKCILYYKGISGNKIEFQLKDKINTLITYVPKSKYKIGKLNNKTYEIIITDENGRVRNIGIVTNDHNRTQEDDREL